MVRLFPKSIRQNALDAQKGAILPLVLVIITAAIAVTALLIDHSREELAAQQLQNAADSLALSGARDLNGSNISYFVLKSYIGQLLRQQSISGVTEAVPANFVFDVMDAPGAVADPDYMEGGGYPHKSTVGRVGNLQIKVERGVYWRKEGTGTDEGKYIFQSIEQKASRPDVGPTADTTNHNTLLHPSLVYNAPAFSIVNAIKVTLTLKDLPTTLGNIFGVAKYGDIEKSSIAVVDKDLEQCVAPLAIPACSLMLNTTDSNDWQYQVWGYRPQDACQRELTFTEADFENPRRLEGIARSDAFPRLPCAKGDPACATFNNRALPIRGVLGLPESWPTSTVSADENETTPEELGNFFKRQSLDGCLKVKVGDRFKPVNSLVEPDGDAKPGFFHDSQVQEQLARWINESPDSEDFTTAFGEPAGRQTLGFPYLRSFRADLKDNADPKITPLAELEYSWPSRYTWVTEGPMIFPFPVPDIPEFPGAKTTGHILMDDMGPSSWTNPMCHDKNIPANDPNRAKARPVVAMVIAPDPDSGQNYCDWANTFQYKDQDSHRPLSGSKPIVVGFVKINMFDFNIMNLEKLYPDQRPVLPSSTPRFPKSMAAAPQSVDHSALGIEANNFNINLQGSTPDITPFKEDFKPDCFDNCMGPEDDPTGKTADECTASCQSNEMPDICAGHGSKQACYLFTLNKCFKATQRVNDLSPPYSPDKYHHPIYGDYDRRRRDLHCLPVKQDDCFPADDPSCWRDPAPLASQFGCGGIRARVSCDGTEEAGGVLPLNPFATPKNNNQRVPSLVRVPVDLPGQ